MAESRNEALDDLRTSLDELRNEMQSSQAIMKAAMGALQGKGLGGLLGQMRGQAFERVRGAGLDYVRGAGLDALRSGGLRGLAGRVAGAGRAAGLGGLGLGAAGGLALGAGAAYGARMTNPNHAELVKQTRLMSQLLNESRRSGQSLQNLVAARAREADPYGRSLRFHRRRAEMLGAMPNQYERTQLAGLADARGQYDLARQGADQARSAFFAPAAAARSTFGMGFQRIRGMAWRGLQSLQQSQYGRSGLGGGLLAINNQLANLNAAGGSLAERQGIEDTAVRRLNRYSFQRLSALGPGNALAPSPTVQAGSEGAYQFQVQQQRRGLQDELTRVWQDKMLNAIERLINQGDATSEDRLSFEARSGRAPTLTE